MMSRHNGERGPAESRPKEVIIDKSRSGPGR
jgi:hypothetical protein